MPGDPFSDKSVYGDDATLGRGPIQALRTGSQQDGGFFDVGDTLSAIPRGVAAAGQDAYGLLDTLSGDNLPDWKSNPFGESKTTVGHLTEGIVNFSTAFIPVEGWLGASSKLGGALNLTRKSEEAAFAAGKLLKGTAIKGARGALAGAIADFTVWDGHEERLSNLIESFPALQNPVTAYLAANPNDGQIEGRLKTALEGVVPGALIDLAVLGVKASKAARVARQAGKAPEEIAVAVEHAAPHAKLAEALRKARGEDTGNAVVRDAAEEFRARKGITEPFPNASEIDVNPDVAKRTADQFDAMAHEPNAPDVKASYDALKRDVAEQYDFLVKEKGLKVEAWPGSGEPYKSSREMATDIRENNHLYFLPTDREFGSGTAVVADHPLFGEAGDGLRYNDKFRIVHDYFGHAAEGNQFGPRGEEIAWRLHSVLFSPEARAALTTETRGQNSWVNYGAHLRRPDGSIPVKGEADFIPPALRPFAPQKAGIMRETPEDAFLQLAPNTPKVARVQKKAALDALIRDMDADKLTWDEVRTRINNLRGDLKEQRIERDVLESTRSRVRGEAYVRERLTRAARQGYITEEEAAFGHWLLDKNPNVANDLGVSIRKGRGAVEGEPGAIAGAYFPTSRVIKLFKNSTNDTTVVHEILHHTERMMPPEVGAGIRKALTTDIAGEIKASVKAGDEKRTRSLYMILSSLAGDRHAREAVAKGLEDGSISHELYRFTNASEYWAVNASEILHGRFSAEGWVQKAGIWLSELLEKAKDLFGLRSDAPVLRGLDEVMRTDGKIRKGGSMFARSETYLDTARTANSTEFGRIAKAMGMSGESVMDAVRAAREESPAGLAAATGESTPFINPRELSKEQRVLAELSKTSMNLANYSGPEDAGHLILMTERMIDALPAELKENLDPVSAERQIAESRAVVGQMIGLDEKTVVAIAARDRVGLQEVRRRLLGYRWIMNSAAKRVVDLVDEVKSIAAGKTQGSEAAKMVEALKAMEFHAELQFQLKGIKNEYGRGLGSLNIEAKSLQGMNPLGTALDPREIEAVINGRGGEDAVRKTFDKFKRAWGEGGEEGAIRVSKLNLATLGNNAFNMLTEYFMNAILSGPRTFVVNVLGPAINSTTRPLEQVLGAQIDRATGGSANAAIIDRALGSITKLGSVVPESFAAAKRMGLSGENQLNPSSSLIDAGTRKTLKRGAITARNAGLDEESLAGQALDWFGRIVRVPTGILSSSDEFVKQLNYRAQAVAHFTVEAREKGIVDVGSHVRDSMDKLIYQDQAYSSQQVWKRAVETSQAKGLTGDELLADATRTAQKLWDPNIDEASKTWLRAADDRTFTTPGAKGSLSRNLQNLVNQHPYLRLVVPFINTPLNILGYTADRLNPANPIRAGLAIKFPDYAKSLVDSRNRVLADFVSGDAARRADAMGKMAVGMSSLVGISAVAASGVLTGRGPSDPEQRRVLMESGWQPYSIRTSDGYVSYARLDPFATLIGTIADVFDYAKFAPLEDQDKVSTLGWGVTVAMANNFTNKSYLTGLSNWIEALQQPDRKLSILAQRYAGSMVPNIGGQAVLSAGDDNLRDVRSMLDAMTARVPGLSTTLPPQRNVLGEPVKRSSAAGAEAISSWVDWFQPVAYSSTTDDVIKKELADLRHGFTPPKSTVDGMDLRDVKLASGQNAYDRRMELQGTVTIGGLKLRDALRREIKSTRYQSLSAVSGDGYESPRVARLNSILRDYQSRALEALKREVPEFAEHQRKYRTTRRLLARGIDPRILPSQD